VGLSFFTFFSFPRKQRNPEGVLAGLANTWNDRKFRRQLLAFPFAWMVFAQLQNVVPVYVLETVPGISTSIVSSLLSANALLVVLLGFRASSLLTRRYGTPSKSKVRGLAFGVSFMALGLLALGLLPWLKAFTVYAFVIPFTLGEMLFVPAYQALINEATPPGRTAAYFGMATLTAGVGMGLGNFAGGHLVEAGRILGPGFFPASAGILALGVAYYYQALAKRLEGIPPA